MAKVTEINFTTEDLFLSEEQIRDRRYKKVEGKTSISIGSDRFNEEYGEPQTIETLTYKITKIGSWMRTDGEQRSVLVAVREDQTPFLEGLMWATEAEMNERIERQVDERFKAMYKDLGEYKKTFRKGFIKAIEDIQFSKRLLWAIGFRKFPMDLIE